MGSMSDIKVRPARPEDRDAVLAFCTHTWDWGDYIEYVWEEWLNDSQGALLVATSAEQPVGVAHLRMLTQTEAWQEGVRVNPQYRRQGIGRALGQAMVAEAMHRGATITRLMTESMNTQSIALSERSFMRRVGACVLLKASPVTAPPKRSYGPDVPQLATEADIDDIINYLNASNIFPAVGGLYYAGFTAYTLTSDLIANKVAAQQVYILRRWDRLDGLALTEPRKGRHDHHLFIGYIDGTTESISLIAYVLREKLTSMGLESVRTFAPDLMMVRDAFVGAEYEWDGKVFYTYERSLSA